MRERLRLAVSGAVQGVGFRPFVYRLAVRSGLDGWVRNSPQGVLIEVDGEHDALDEFRSRLLSELPPRAVIQGVESSWLDASGTEGFEIRETAQQGAVTALAMADIATCHACRREIFDPADRRYRYPFTNCTDCGPRFSLIEALPYDREATSMRRFGMCPACQREYDDPLDRRFHAQPNACPACGPQLELWDGRGRRIADRDDALRAAACALLGGQIVAVKGLGGFHLMTLARDNGAIVRLRRRKGREEKPLALMYPDPGLVARHCVVSADEGRLLDSPEAPIVLLARRRAAATEIAESVAPGNPELGVMLPYTPLHLLLMREVNLPLVATSGNVSDEPICTDEREAVRRLGGIADLFLVHNRPIVRHVDDSIVRVLLGRELVVRRARGYAPLPIPLRRPAPPVLAVGGHLKNTVAVASGANVFLSQHIGDLDSEKSTAAFIKVIDDLQSLFAVEPVAVITDLHPDYRSTTHARTRRLPVFQVQHHYAHVAACMLENDLDGPVLGVSWDGTGYGQDRTIWGGEFLTVSEDAGFTRAACMRPFRLPGGDRAIREPRRAALGLLLAMAGPEAETFDIASTHAFSGAERALLIQALAHGVNSPVTTSVGRLFDAVASMIDLRQRSSFEGQAAMELEHAIDVATDEAYPFDLTTHSEPFATGSWESPPLVVDWAPAVRAILDDVRTHVARGTVAARFHNTLAEVIVAVAEHIDQRRVILTGGCFQNRHLTERTVTRLRQRGFRPYWHQRVPPNDGGLALGQIAAYLRGLRSADAPEAGQHERMPVLR